jgi:serine/threonine protein kinase
MIEEKKYDNSVDVWSVGILTYELIFGRSPFVGKNPEETFKKVIKVIFYLVCFFIIIIFYFIE